MRKKLRPPWANISDLMAALMMVFLFISISYAFQVTKQTIQLEKTNEKISNIIAQYSDDRALIYNSLIEKFGPKLDEWKATINKDTLTLRFNDPALLFETGSSKLTPRFSLILEEFWSDYVMILSKYSGSIREVKIEGHTSSEWLNASSLEESYFNNMKLSQERTRSTLRRCYDLTPSSYLGWVRSSVTANGMSFSRPAMDKNGKEDKDMSRRVEFTIVVDSKSKLDQIRGELK